MSVDDGRPGPLLTAPPLLPEVARRTPAGAQLFELLVAGVVDYAILTLDLHGRVTSWNTGAARIKGYTADQILGRSFQLFYPPDDVAAGKPAMELRVATATGRFEDEGWRVRRDGTRFWANVIITALRDMGGTHIGFSKLTRDMTERRAAEQAVQRANEGLERRVSERTALLEARNEELDAFTYSVSHDLRAPLRAIDGFVDILASEHGGTLEPQARELLDDVAANARHMGRLIDDLLGFARLGRHGLAVGPVATRELVEAVATRVADDARPRAVQVDVGDLPDCWADRGLLEQVFVNLLSNAVKYTRDVDGAGIRVRGRQTPEGCSFEVSDDGVGFDPRYVHKLFGVFQRLHRAEEYEGTGVGLAIVKRIVVQHGGQVSAVGAVGHGATITFSLPEGGPA